MACGTFPKTLEAKVSNLIKRVGTMGSVTRKKFFSTREKLYMKLFYFLKKSLLRHVFFATRCKRFSVFNRLIIKKDTISKNHYYFLEV